MTLGRTSSGSMKIKSDGGLRAVECECCCDYSSVEIRSVSASMEVFGDGSFTNTGKKFLKHKITGTFNQSHELGLIAREINAEKQINPWTGAASYSGLVNNYFGANEVDCNLVSETETTRVFSCGAVCQDLCPGPSYTDLDQFVTGDPTLAPIVREDTVCFPSYTRSLLEENTVQATAQRVDEMLGFPSKEDIPKNSNAKMYAGDGGAVGFAISGAASCSASFHINENTVSKTKLFLKFNKNTTYTITQNNGPTQTFQAKQDDEIIINPPATQGELLFSICCHPFVPVQTAILNNSTKTEQNLKICTGWYVNPANGKKYKTYVKSITRQRNISNSNAYNSIEKRQYNDCDYDYPCPDNPCVDTITNNQSGTKELNGYQTDIFTHTKNPESEYPCEEIISMSGGGNVSNNNFFTYSYFTGITTSGIGFWCEEACGSGRSPEYRTANTCVASATYDPSAGEIPGEGVWTWTGDMPYGEGNTDWCGTPWTPGFPTPFGGLGICAQQIPLNGPAGEPRSGSCEWQIPLDGSNGPRYGGCGGGTTAGIRSGANTWTYQENSDGWILTWSAVLLLQTNNTHSEVGLRGICNGNGFACKDKMVANNSIQENSTMSFNDSMSWIQSVSYQDEIDLSNDEIYHAPIIIEQGNNDPLPPPVMGFPTASHYFSESLQQKIKTNIDVNCSFSFLIPFTESDKNYKLHVSIVNFEQSETNLNVNVERHVFELTSSGGPQTINRHIGVPVPPFGIHKTFDVFAFLEIV